MFTIPGKIPIKIHPLFIVVVIGLSLINSNFQLISTLLWVFVICVSILVHEMGHALTAIACGQHASIDLVGFGGLTHRKGKRLKPLQEFIIVLNGPLAGFLLGLLSYTLLVLGGTRLPPLAYQTLLISTYVNIFWTIVNLLPVHPLDGGQLLRITLEGFFGVPGLKIALFLSFLAGLIFSIFLFTIQMFLLGSFFLLFTYESFLYWKSSLPKTKEDDNIVSQQFIKSAEKDFYKGHLGYAEAKLNTIRETGKAGVLYNSATLLLAQVFHAQGKEKEALGLLTPIKKTLNPELQLLFLKMAYNEGRWQEAIDMGNKVYQHVPTSEVALLNAFTHAKLGEATPAIGWLRCAIDNGLPNVKKVLEQTEFNAIRNDPSFVSLTSQIE